MFTNTTIISTKDTSGSFLNGEAYTDTSLDGCIFAQVFGGSSSVTGNATLVPVTIHYTVPTSSDEMAIANSLVTINDTALNVNYQVYMQYGPSVIGSPWKLEINGKDYGTTDFASPSHVFLDGSNNINITV